MNTRTFQAPIKLMLWSVLSLMTCLSAQAQVTVRLKMDKKDYLLGEAVTATVSITNRAGRQLVLSENNISSWLNFQVTSGGRTVLPGRKINYKPTVIPIGQTVARSVNLSTMYSLSSPGNYSCYCSVRMPGPKISGATSNRTQFTIANGRTSWVQEAGLSGSKDEIREYKLITFRGNRGLDLYAQINSKNTGRRIVTIPLGKVITFRNPSAALDGSNSMHVIYQVKPDLFTHVVISANGQVLSSNHHKRGTSGSPRLVTFGNGAVRVAGTVPYNAKAEAEKRRQIRGIAERPKFLYR